MLLPAMLFCRATSSLTLLVVALLAGCSAESPHAAPDAPDSRPRPGVTLRLFVENDPELQRAILRLRGEWTERSGGDLQLLSGNGPSESAPSSSIPDEADLVVFASRRLGQLCESRLIRPMRKSVLTNPDLRIEDLLPLVRQQEMRYGNIVMALPLGCPTPLVVTSEAAERMPTAFPDDPTELALAYLAWVAPHAVHPARSTVLFSHEKLRPRLTEPPFVRALEEVVALATDQPRSTLVWPQRGSKTKPPLQHAMVQVTPPPGATEHYNLIAEAWEPLEEGGRRATLLASSGRLLAVTTSSSNAAEAFRFAAWLAGPGNCRQLATACDGVANPRGSFARAPDDWLGGEDRQIGRQFSEMLARSLRSRRYLLAPRLPASDQYLKALGEAIATALRGECEPIEALRFASEAWEALTDEVGREKQLRAYLRSVGAQDYVP